MQRKLFSGLSLQSHCSFFFCAICVSSQGVHHQYWSVCPLGSHRLDNDLHRLVILSGSANQMLGDILASCPNPTNVREQAGS